MPKLFAQVAKRVQGVLSLFCVGSDGIRGGGSSAAHVAQLVEHVLGKDEVVGSIPIVGCRSGRTRRR